MSDSVTQINQRISVRMAKPADAATLFQLVQALAEYEHLLNEVIGSADALAQHLFGTHPYVEAILAESGAEPIGFALFFPTYSTILGRPSFYLEDLFVRPEYRGQGVGKALFRELARLANNRQCGQLEWSVLDWNEPAIAFYRRIGADLSDTIRICRVADTALVELAQGSAPSVRAATAADVPVLFALAKANAEHHQMLSTFTASSDRLAEQLFGSHPAVEAVVAERDGQIAGFALFFHNYSTFLTQPGLYIEDLFVQADYRRQGVGRELLSYLAQHALDHDCGRLEWFVQRWNDNAIAFYKRLGAVILEDWRICCLNQDAIAALAASGES